MNQESEKTEIIQKSRIKTGVSTTIKRSVYLRILKVQGIYLEKYPSMPKPFLFEVIDQGLSLLEDKLKQS